MPSLTKKDVNRILITILFLILATLSICLLWKLANLLTALLFFLAIAYLAYVKSKKLALVFLFCGFGGCVVEIIAIEYGAWHYTLPTLFNIPLWLFPAWGIAGILCASLYKLLDKIPSLEKNNN